MAQAAAPVPAGCSPKCTLDCDLWSGSLECGGVRWSVYGGTATMAGMQLDQGGAQVEGRETLVDAALLRWGKGKQGQFCAAVAQDGWNWEICAPDVGNQREAVLGMARGYTRSFPKERVIKCNNTSC